jgi:hypothetical protein
MSVYKLTPEWAEILEAGPNTAFTLEEVRALFKQADSTYPDAVYPSEDGLTLERCALRNLGIGRQNWTICATYFDPYA